MYALEVKNLKKTFSTGRRTIKAVMNDIVKEAKPYTCFGEIENYFQEMDIFTKRWMKEVESKVIRGRLIGSKTQNFKVARSEEYKYLPNYFFSEMTTVTYGDKTALFIWSTPIYVVLIDNKEVTKSNQNTFNHFWKEGEIPSKKDKSKRVFE